VARRKGEATGHDWEKVRKGWEERERADTRKREGCEEVKKKFDPR
jgi:hypothetical protein